MLEALKIIASLLGGGLAGVFVNEWLRRRREKVQRVQLIERVNRPVSALEGFTVARPSADGALVEVKDVREYQLTMRNSTSTHLVDVEVQFDFPASDVQALVSLPAMSRTPLVVNPPLQHMVQQDFGGQFRTFPLATRLNLRFGPLLLQRINMKLRCTRLVWLSRRLSVNPRLRGRGLLLSLSSLRFWEV
jgi:hypothetical protein